MLKSRLHSAVYNFSIIELVFVALDKGCLRWGIPIFAIRKLGEEGGSSNYHILMNNRANFNE